MPAIGFDFGLTRIGVATGQTLTQTATPLTVVVAEHGVPDWNDIAVILDDWKPDIVVVGLPLHEDGSMSEMAERAKRSDSDCMEDSVFKSHLSMNITAHARRASI